MAARQSTGVRQPAAAFGPDRSAFTPSLLLSVLLHVGLAVGLVAVPSPRAPPGRAWIESRPPSPPPPAPEPPSPSPESASASETAATPPRPATRRRRAAPAGPAAPDGGSSAPLSGLDSSGPGVPFDVPATSEPKGMAFPEPGQQPGTATAGPAPRAPIRLDDGSWTPEEVKRIAREVKQGFDAQPHSIAVQKYGGPVARQSTFFPGYGDVPSDKVCRTRDGQAFRTTIPEFDLTVCDRWEVDRSRIDDHTDAPPVVCVESHVEHLEEKILEAPRFYLSHECMQRDPDHWDIDWDRRTVQYRCIRWLDIERENPLVYRAKKFTDSYEEDRGISMRIEVPPCDEPTAAEAPAQPAEEGATASGGG